ncbi:MAG: M1 family aminopeptidase [Chloroflexi bacterium]|nr:M1 family aminopeptidase [Chloroflexota bacterium]
MNSNRRHDLRLNYFFTWVFLLTACAAAQVNTNTSTDPRPSEEYVLVTANPQATNTPFQPSLPTETPLFTETVSPSETATTTPIPQPTNTIQPPDAPTAEPTDAEPAQVPGPTDAAPQSAPASVDKPNYNLSVLMDYAGHTVTVNEIVVYPNRSSSELSNIAFGVNPNLWSGVFTLQSVSINNRGSSNYNLAGQWLTVTLDAALQPGQEVKIGITYQLSLPYSSAKLENFGYTGRQTNLIDWYPFVPPNIAGQWVLPDPFVYGENLVYDKADFRVSLTFADPVNAPVVAASAPAVLENGALVYNLPNARNFTISASPEYLVSTANANGITIYNYYFASDATAAAMVLELTRMSVNTYSFEFGPYPHLALSVCETDLNDGLETDGLYFLASSFYQSFDGSVRNNLSTIAVHETAHQWWYGAVASNQAVEPWLDEAMATYSEHVFYEDNYPDLLTWWWNFRVDSHGPSGWVDSRVYDTSNFRAYVNAVYFNGARFIQSLRDRLGDQVFYAFIRDYYSRNNGRIATANDFFAILDLHTSIDTTDLVNTFFYYR